jgi:hypothetical protein
MSRNVRSSLTCIHISCRHLFAKILELLQGYDSNPLNLKKIMHQAWVDMIKLNALTHELEKFRLWRQENKTPCFQESIKMKSYLFKLVMVVSNSTSLSEVSSKI